MKSDSFKKPPNVSYNIKTIQKLGKCNIILGELFLISHMDS